MSAALPVPVPAPVNIARARFIPVIGDSMEPTLPRNGMVAVVPVNGYRAERLYVLDVLPGAKPSIMRCERVFGASAIRVWYDNTAYGSHTVPQEWFESAVVGKVAAVLEITDRTLLEDVA